VKVDLARTSGHSGLKPEIKEGAFTDSLRVGDRIDALALSGGKRSALIKTENGHIIRARLEEDVKLLPGVKVQLEVSGKESGSVYLSIISMDESKNKNQDEAAVQPDLIDGISNKNLALCISHLKELYIPVTKETVSLMQGLIEQNPSITLDEAAFLASNRLLGDGDYSKSALMVLFGDAKMDAMLTHLVELMNEQGTAGQSNSNEESGFRVSILNPTNLPMIITPSKSNVQSIDVKKVETDGHNDEYTQDGIAISGRPEFTCRDIFVVKPPDKTLSTTQNQIEARNTKPPVIATQGNKTFISGSRIPHTEFPDSIAFWSPESSVVNSIKTSRAIMDYLSKLPEFRNTPTEALEKFTNTLLRAADDSASATNENTANLTALIDKLFARIGRNDKDDGQRLKNAREEFYARLMFIEEEISRSVLPQKTEALEQTRRLMDYTRLSNSINQFVYMQLPVIIGGYRKIAELYLFKRKDGKPADSENVNILLALELEHMGHWEALVSFREKAVSIQMEVSGKREKEHFSENSILLCGMLAEAGFKLVNTDIKTAKKETTLVTALVSLERHLSERAGMFDLLI
jgi:hypothetical protein